MADSAIQVETGNDVLHLRVYQYGHRVQQVKLEMTLFRQKPDMVWYTLGCTKMVTPSGRQNRK
ncbi:Hypothetical predicted protein [Pelobates cultripes]|uniref:Uncharacterized protein n=1 Tax=Pelobates cultripes TaxID=61616 RepID=A0AAD1VN51_PELCU|nr:Hypothetical predicted protein [Pelobates cultripes]